MDVAKRLLGRSKTRYSAGWYTLLHGLEDNVKVFKSVLKPMYHVLDGVEVLLVVVLYFLDLSNASDCLLHALVCVILGFS